jgi:hypothetical protein
MPDDQIDTSDISEVKDPAGWVKVHEHPEHPFTAYCRSDCQSRTGAATRPIKRPAVPNLYQVAEREVLVFALRNLPERDNAQE